MKALIRGGQIVTVEVISRKKLGWLFPREYCLVQYKTDVLHNNGSIRYTKLEGEWVLADNVFDE